LNGTAGLILAAGASTRMGTLKQLLPVGQATLLDHVLAQALQSGLERVVLVLGFRAEAILKGLKGDLRHPKLSIIVNKNFPKGISSSLIAGLSVVEKDAQGVMIILGDMPHITTSLINLLLDNYEKSPLSLAALTSKSKRSHPVIIGRPFFSALHRLRGDEGAKALFAEAPDHVLLVQPPEEYDDTDIDTLDEYLALRKKLEQ
jgi:molybdenum cofactor cytidylyltransferase